VAHLIRFQERNSARGSRQIPADREHQKIEAEAEDWDEASQMVRHYLKLAETALKEEEPPPARKRRRTA
jgi:hypothetical protein